MKIDISYSDNKLNENIIEIEDNDILHVGWSKYHGDPNPTVDIWIGEFSLKMHINKWEEVIPKIIEQINEAKKITEK